MRPYLAIIADSFHSALASRVLWAAFLAIWILLAALAPIGTREDYTTSFQWLDVYNGTRMKALLAQGIVDPKSQDKAIGRVAAAMPEEMRRQLQRVGEGDEVRIRLSLLTDALNELIESDATGQSDWYDEQAWSETVRFRELRTLDETADEELSDSLQRRRSRLRLEAALPGVFESRSIRSLSVTYAGLEFPTAFQIDRAQFETLFNQFVIPLLVNWLLGLVLVFLGVLVTASIIPDMLQTGSLHLLLSKPISRASLLISKFIGGCAFVLLCVTQLVIGLYLIAAFRLDVWNTRILWCIPVAAIIFAVFFSVSVLAGLKWRSAIISIAAAGALAAICVVVGVIGGVVDARVVAPDRIAGMTFAGDDLFAVTGGSGLVRMDTPLGSWETLDESKPGSNDRVLKPVTLDDDHVLTAKIRNGRFNPFGSGSLDLIVLARNDPANPTKPWQPQPSIRLPTATERLLTIEGRAVIAINTADLLVTPSEAVFEAIGAERQPESAPENETAENESAENDGTSSSRGKRVPVGNSVSDWLKALVTMQGGATESFTSILPRDVVLSPPVRITRVLGTRSLLLLTGDRLQRIEPGTDIARDPWTTTARGELPRESDRAAYVIAASSRWTVVARGDAPMRIFDSVTLQPTGQWDVEASDSAVSGTPLEMIAIAEDRFLLRTSSGHCDVLRVIPTDPEATPDESTAADQKTAAQSNTLDVISRFPIDEIESIVWRPDPSDNRNGTLLAAHEVDRLTRLAITFDESSMSSESPAIEIDRERTIVPPRSAWRWIDYYVVGAFETLTPKVLQLGDTTAAMVSGNDSLVIGGGESETPEVVRYKIVGPLTSCGIFIAVIMGIACVYFSRSDY